MKKYILLDWDGNLAKTLDVWIEACRFPLEKRGLKFTDEKIASCFGIPYERFTEWGIKDVDNAIQQMDEVAAKLLPEVTLYPDAVFVLEKLKTDGKQMALITSSHHTNVIKLLDKYNLHGYFDAVITYDDTKRHKPHPEPLQKALDELGGTLQDAIMIGDTEKDIVAANNAGIDSVLFFPPEHAKFYKLDELKTYRPTHIIDDFRKLLEIT